MNNPRKINIEKYYILIPVFLFLTILPIFFFYCQKTVFSFTNVTYKKETDPYDHPKPLTTPEKVKAIYLTGYSFNNSEKRKEVTDILNNTELNSLVIDIKDPNNKLIFTPLSPILKSLPISKSALDNEKIKEILADWQRQNIYTIARITTFQDNSAVEAMPALALKNTSGGTWKNRQGIPWLDMTNPKAWKLPMIEAKEVASLGFDEVQFDYIRFPSDGDTSKIKYFDLPADKKRIDKMVEFYQYLNQNLTELKIPLSIDLFGLTYQRHKDPLYDLNIGQRLVDVAPYFDFISPMVYPSHYPSGFLGLANPAEYPYEVVNKAMQEGSIILGAIKNVRAKTRPWLQDFDIGANYDAEMIKAQIKACDDNNTTGWILWNPKNIYTLDAIKKDSNL